ncbi:MAG: dihydrolipoamide acyltransferase [Gammaproteobacteria bacterium]|nr:dihydrolipoamide acyltransferase [Rhodocyclaceae bacterium]MBU3909444.1 dihydrolipoamide acyltransferase [Gammaproteobacteria bacterium]MBU3988296.1 dihydrolipoamide acyltransferase [Gammaproteobacteria bacterium]MBU4003622.1 dihydrolipoamide acyltransferase [Gammaproteobacteria bacterium]MBU4021980.1 dihydrolipoamide acyltransferase [Gammaproteobacteria bacterium]
MAVEVRLPRFPECWESCGNCGQSDVLVLEVHVKPGDILRHDDNLITLETGKVALDIGSPHAGCIVEVFVSEGDTVSENALIATIEPG